MAKSPNIRHSKPTGEPVTIELGAGDVSRVSDETRAEARTGKAPAGSGPAATAKPQQGESPEPRSSEPQPAASPAGEPPRSATGSDRPASGPSAKERPTAGGAGSFVGGLVGAVVALALASSIAWYAGWLPTGEKVAAPASDEVGMLQNQIAALRDSIADLKASSAASAPGVQNADTRIEGLAASIEDLRGRMTKLEESPSPAPADGPGLDALRTALTALEKKVAALPVDGSSATDALKSEIARLDAGVKAASDSAASATEAARQASIRADEIAKALAALSARVAEQDKTPSVALAIAASSLKAAVDRGGGFTTELDTYASLAPDSPDVAALRPMAAGGVPTREQIARKMDAAADAMIEAGRTVDPQAGFVDRLWQSAQSLVKVRPVGNAEGSGVPAIVARIEAAVNGGDYARALEEYESLPPDSKAAGADLMASIKARQSADELTGRLLAAALRS